LRERVWIQHPATQDVMPSVVVAATKPRPCRRQSQRDGTNCSRGRESPEGRELSQSRQGRHNIISFEVLKAKSWERITPLVIRLASLKFRLLCRPCGTTGFPFVPGTSVPGYRLLRPFGAQGVERFGLWALNQSRERRTQLERCFLPSTGGSQEPHPPA
jgi:hypothetical protein